jgi:hypothetical protein
MEWQRPPDRICELLRQGATTIVNDPQAWLDELDEATLSAACNAASRSNRRRDVGSPPLVSFIAADQLSCYDCCRVPLRDTSFQAQQTPHPSVPHVWDTSQTTKTAGQSGEVCCGGQLGAPTSTGFATAPYAVARVALIDFKTHPGLK